MKNDLSNEKDILLSTAELGYQDRKMAKWQGFILSDHTEMIQASEELAQEHTAKEKQSLSVISDFLHRSFAYGHRLSIQLEFMVNGSYEPDVVGRVTGFENEQIYVQTEEELIVIDLTLIRHIELIASSKWFNSDPT